MVGLGSMLGRLLLLQGEPFNKVKGLSLGALQARFCGVKGVVSGVFLDGGFCIRGSHQNHSEISQWDIWNSFGLMGHFSQKSCLCAVVFPMQTEYASVQSNTASFCLCLRVAILLAPVIQ